MKEDKKENGDEEVTTVENEEGGQPEKRARIDETENDQSNTELNGTKISENLDDTVENEDDVQEIKVEVPLIEIGDEEVKSEVETDVVSEASEPEPVKDSPTPAVVKTTPTRGRGGRGRGTTARRGRSSR